MRDSIQGRQAIAPLKPDSLDHPFHRGNPLRFRIAVDAAPIYQYFQFVIGVLHLRRDAVLGFKFALQAPGQASQAGSYQAAANFDLHGFLSKFGCLLSVAKDLLFSVR